MELKLCNERYENLLSEAHVINVIVINRLKLFQGIEPVLEKNFWSWQNKLRIWIPNFIQVGDNIELFIYKSNMRIEVVIIFSEGTYKR